MIKNIFAQRALMIFGVLFLGYLYLYPGLNPIFTGQTNLVMSDNTDPAALPFQYEKIIQVWKDHPSYMFYGAIYSDSLDPEQGAAYWMAWSERWIVILLSNFVPLEQIGTFVVFFLLIFSAFAMFALGRYLGWSRSVSYGLGLAWAFCAYTRARAKVHMSMTGVFHLPLIFLGLYLVVRGKSWRSNLLAGLCFLVAASTVHYYIVTVAFLSLFFIAFVLIQPEFKSQWGRITSRLLLAVVPAVAFLIFNILNPIPSGTAMSAQNAVPETGKMPEGKMHPFLFTYSAQPIDFLTNDLSLERTPDDLNPLRYMINEHVQTTLTTGNLHERTNGIRWSILILGFMALGLVLFNKAARSLLPSREILFFSALGLFCFWLSMDPDTPFSGWGPSGWLYQLVNQIRVTNRAGIFVHFSFLMIVGFLLSSQVKYKWKSWLTLPLVFPALMVIDYPPLVQQMPMAKIAPSFMQLPPHGQVCGTGLYFPYISPWTDVAYYHFLQRLRGTDCRALNSAASPAQLQFMSNRFPPSNQFLQVLDRYPQVQDSLLKIASCVPLHWIIFDPSVPELFRQSTCQKLGWVLYPDLSCIDPKPHRAFEKWPDKCIN